jgi:hypothetical protein
MFKYAFYQHVGEYYAAAAVTAATGQGLPIPVHWCSICALKSPNHSPQCEYLQYASSTASFVLAGLKLS